MHSQSVPGTEIEGEEDVSPGNIAGQRTANAVAASLAASSFPSCAEERSAEPIDPAKAEDKTLDGADHGDVSFGEHFARAKQAKEARERRWWQRAG